MTLSFIATVFVSFPPCPWISPTKVKNSKDLVSVDKKSGQIPVGGKMLLKKKERQFIPSNLAEVGLEISLLRPFFYHGERTSPLEAK